MQRKRSVGLRAALWMGLLVYGAAWGLYREPDAGALISTALTQLRT